MAHFLLVDGGTSSSSSVSAVGAKGALVAVNMTLVGDTVMALDEGGMAAVGPALARAADAGLGDGGWGVAEPENGGGAELLDVGEVVAVEQGGTYEAPGLLVGERERKLWV